MHTLEAHSPLLDEIVTEMFVCRYGLQHLAHNVPCINHCLHVCAIGDHAKLEWRHGLCRAGFQSMSMHPIPIRALESLVPVHLHSFLDFRHGAVVMDLVLYQNWSCTSCA